MEIKLALLACFISFLFGTTAVIMLNKVHEVKEEAIPKVCVVNTKKGNEMHVWVGRLANQ
jgi:hypothetical protein